VNLLPAVRPVFGGGQQNQTMRSCGLFSRFAEWGNNSAAGKPFGELVSE